MNILFVLLLITADGGINTNLRFNSLEDCKAASTSIFSSPGAGWGSSQKGGLRYLSAVCVTARGLKN